MNTRIPTPREQVDRAITETGARYGLSLDQVLTRSKDHRYVPGRHAVWLDLMCERGWTTVILSKRLKRHHATIIYGIRRAAQARYGVPVNSTLADIRAAYVDSQRQVAA
jgi:hypothetical protein